MLQSVLLTTLIALTLGAHAEPNGLNNQKSKTYSYDVPNYAAAKASSDYVKIELNAKILFFINYPITAYVRKFSVIGDYVDSQLQNGVIKLQPQDIDTSSERMNRKMLRDVFKAETFPKLTLRLGTPIQLNGSVSKTAGSIDIRGNSQPIEINYTTKETKDTYIIDGLSALSMKTMNIADPSYFFMKLEDSIQLSLHFDLKKSDIKNTPPL